VYYMLQWFDSYYDTQMRYVVDSYSGLYSSFSVYLEDGHIVGVLQCLVNHCLIIDFLLTQKLSEYVRDILVPKCRY
jgi:hypothetical protein